MLFLHVFSYINYTYTGYVILCLFSHTIMFLNSYMLIYTTIYFDCFSVLVALTNNVTVNILIHMLKFL